MSKTDTIKNEILTRLKEAPTPLSVPQLMEILEKNGLTPNKTTIYRHIQTFLKKKVITEVILKNGVAYYEHTNHHHHHFFCTECERVLCLDLCSLEPHIQEFKSSLQAKKIKIHHHEFNLYGTCESCTP